MRVAALGAAVLAIAALTACSSSSSAKHTVAPVSSSPVSSAPSSSSTPSASPSAAPLSAFEQDPAVKAFRQWAIVGARTVNTGHYSSAALTTISGPYLKKHLKDVFASDVGKYYPGPVPFQPVGVQIVSSARRNINGCVVTSGFAENSRTHRPAGSYHVQAAVSQVLLISGRWTVDSLYFVNSFSCKGVSVRTQTW